MIYATTISFPLPERIDLLLRLVSSYSIINIAS